MPTVILRESIHFSGAESLYRKLEALDPAFRRAAKIVDYDYSYETTLGGKTSWWHGTLKLEAEIDASPEA